MNFLLNICLSLDNPTTLNICYIGFLGPFQITSSPVLNYPVEFVPTYNLRRLSVAKGFKLELEPTRVNQFLCSSLRHYKEKTGLVNERSI